MIKIKRMSLRRVSYAREKEQFLERRLETWQSAQVESQPCFELEDVIRDVNRFFDDILGLDRDIRDGYADGCEYSEELDSQLTGLMNGWAALGERLMVIIQKFEQEGFEVEGATPFRKNLSEARSIACPASDDIPDGLAKIRDQAIEDYEAGKFLVGLTD